ncbi:SUKH-3 domain-containing protein [Streptomyces sp. NEAU-YJ-81]|uniref:SUKH-3 domain-containing protein n=1 Tax=Streptomyces sp. NEAU-YJ-81 TaxID=2820288 RepID=UPI001ABC626A|nr:SUKH-3 domain-containing protein [Streptomyces sp. NEAU-YJ-81]MBO3675368.1 SUKH-3 domain-containing protein [Streptomyces sp. NEAU-YJ-81]
MPRQLTHEEIDARLRTAGWHPGRDAGEEAVAALMASAVGQLQSHEYEADPFPAAFSFLQEFAFLDLEFSGDPPTEHLVFEVRFIDAARAEEISELSADLQQPLFPVAFEENDRGMAVMDPLGRFFYIHWSGFYYLGKGRYDVLNNLLTGDNQGDAAEFYV